MLGQIRKHGAIGTQSISLGGQTRKRLAQKIAIVRGQVGDFLRYRGCRSHARGFAMLLAADSRERLENIDEIFFADAEKRGRVHRSRRAARNCRRTAKGTSDPGTRAARA